MSFKKFEQNFFSAKNCKKKFESEPKILRVKCQNRFLVAAKQEERRHVPGRDVQPRHVDPVWQRLVLLRHRQGHDHQGRVPRVFTDELGDAEIEVGLLGVVGQVGLGDQGRAVGGSSLGSGPVGLKDGSHHLLKLIPIQGLKNHFF